MPLNIYIWKFVSTTTEIHKDIDLEVQLVDIQNEGDNIDKEPRANHAHAG